MVNVVSISSSVPKHRYKTEDMIDKFPSEISEEVKQNILNLGVNYRNLLFPLEDSNSKEISEDISNVAIDAIKKCVKAAGLGYNDINHLVVTSDASDYLCPGLSSTIVGKLELDPFIHHLNIQGMACTAFSESLKVADNILSSSTNDNVLVVVSGCNSTWFIPPTKAFDKIIGPKEIKESIDKNSQSIEFKKWILLIQAFLFGDGVSAFIVRKNSDNSLAEIKNIESVTNLDSDDRNAAFYKLGINSKDFKTEIFSRLGSTLPELGVKYSKIVFERLMKNSPVKDIEKWIVHTGSKSILDTIAGFYKIDMEKIKESYEVLANYGNLAGASLPFILEKIINDGNVKKESNGIALGFGWGFSACACSMKFG